MLNRTNGLALSAAALAIAACSSIGNEPTASTASSDVVRPEVSSDFEYPTYKRETIIDEAENAFGQFSAELAEVVDGIFNRRGGGPQAFIAGEEVGGAIGVGLTYGKGMLYRPNQEPIEVFWQGPSLGFDLGGDASKVFIPVYDLGPTENLYRRYPGGGGNVYFVGGVGGEAMTQKGVTVVPIRSGIGARAGVSVEYIKFTQERDVNPF
ncbi:EipA family protein [Parvularcula maris]|uniref:DUF1134 domain-containing protein n=1 Tax=Parvularcula maris TaxID=2965077 RepID=A0A9X2RII2_9PROT|nr:EipA family protein [Parvularcula maris]MCQ8183917.1 DUF1134 domain-containing protein [Parvularcula maris]